jgi:hypothetical protein
MSSESRLKDILSRSKAVMRKTEESYGTTTKTMSETSNSTVSYEEKEMPNLTENYIQNRSGVTSSVAPRNGQYRNLEKSKLPDFIKKAMVENPIEIPETPFHTFDLDDVSDLVVENETKPQPQKKQVNKEVSLDLNETVIRKIVREEMEDLVRGVIEEYLDKSLVTEDIQIKIGNTIFSGNLKPLPNKKK